jgi:hypothetical protein
MRGILFLKKKYRLVDQDFKFLIKKVSKAFLTSIFKRLAFFYDPTAFMVLYRRFN